MANAGAHTILADFRHGPLSAGVHTLRVETDINNTIAESDETNNWYERQFVVLPPGGGATVVGHPRPRPQVGVFGDAEAGRNLVGRFERHASAVSGQLVFSTTARNCWPCCGLTAHRPRPSGSSHSPSCTSDAVPTTVRRSRCPFTCTRSTAKPVSALWKVTRSIRPDRCSRSVPAGMAARGTARGGCRAAAARQRGLSYSLKIVALGHGLPTALAPPMSLVQPAPRINRPAADGL